jgi:large subunit ribosomal protein L17
MVTSLFKYEKIQTTDVKAKELRKWADNIITLAKRGDLHARRQVLSIIREKDVVHKLFENANEKYGERAGGYTRIVKMGRRPGDASPVSLIEIISKETAEEKKKTKKAKKVDKTSTEKTAPAKAPEPAEQKTEAADTKEAKASATETPDVAEPSTSNEAGVQENKTKENEE